MSHLPIIIDIVAISQYLLVLNKPSILPMFDFMGETVGKDHADESEVQILSLLAADPSAGRTTSISKYDMMAYNLTKGDVCDALLDWIREGKPVTRTTMRGQDAGNAGYEIWPDFAGRLFYCKFVVRELPAGRTLVIVSSHPDG